MIRLSMVRFGRTSLFMLDRGDSWLGDQTHLVSAVQMQILVSTYNGEELNTLKNKFGKIPQMPTPVPPQLNHLPAPVLPP